MTASSPPHPVHLRYPVLERPRAVALLRSLRDDGPSMVAALAARLGGSGETVGEAVRTLAQAGLARYGHEGPGPMVVRLADAGREALEELDGTNRDGVEAPR